MKGMKSRQKFSRLFSRAIMLTGSITALVGCSATSLVTPKPKDFDSGVWGRVSKEITSSVGLDELNRGVGDKHWEEIAHYNVPMEDIRQTFVRRFFDQKPSEILSCLWVDDMQPIYIDYRPINVDGLFGESILDDVYSWKISEGGVAVEFKSDVIQKVQRGEPINKRSSEPPAFCKFKSDENFKTSIISALRDAISELIASAKIRVEQNRLAEAEALKQKQKQFMDETSMTIAAVEICADGPYLSQSDKEYFVNYVVGNMKVELGDNYDHKLFTENYEFNKSALKMTGVRTGGCSKLASTIRRLKKKSATN